MAELKPYEGYKEWRVARSFATEGHGPWEAGATVQLLYEDAAWILRSSPGNPESDDKILQSPVIVTEAEYKKLYPPKTSKTGKKGKDRMVKGSQNRADS